MLRNACLFAKIGLDTAEDEAPEVSLQNYQLTEHVRPLNGSVRVQQQRVMWWRGLPDILSRIRFSVFMRTYSASAAAAAACHVISNEQG